MPIHCPNWLTAFADRPERISSGFVIDDGSTDDTEAYMEALKQQNLPFEWEYHKKEIGGKHTALNAAHPYIKGDVVLILDSDDYLTPDAVETVEREWPCYRNRPDLCGMSYFKARKMAHI